MRSCQFSLIGNEAMFAIEDPSSNRSAVIIGAGPAGLTAADRLTEQGYAVTVLEKDQTYVGGISKTIRYKGFHFDIGGHRFFSKSREVENYWRETLGNALIERRRKSRIFYNGTLFSYPLKPFDTLLKLGPYEAFVSVFSYLKARLWPIREPKNFEEWITNQFGQRLFKIFFKTYTEKVWGMRCDEISADWAAQRIKGLSTGKAILNSILPNRPGRQMVKTLIDSFRYPRLGPGMMWEAIAEKVTTNGGKLLMDREVIGCEWDRTQNLWRVRCRNGNGHEESYRAGHVVSSMALRELVAGLAPAPSEATCRAARSLKYRDFLIVALVTRDRDQFDDNWIYVHEPGVKVGRIQNFKSWSPDMVPDPTFNCYGMEYFCFEDDELWKSDDGSLIELATAELVSLGLAATDDIVDGCVIRQEKAYPVYDAAYQANVAQVRSEIEASYPNLHVIGRNGMHRYNNQDHAIMTAILAVKNIVAGKKIYDVWRVNQDAEYHEEDTGSDITVADSERLTPGRTKEA
jgi:protoporphyrinogen oxidase